VTGKSSRPPPPDEGLSIPILASIYLALERVLVGGITTHLDMVPAPAVTVEPFRDLAGELVNGLDAEEGRVPVDGRRDLDERRRRGRRLRRCMAIAIGWPSMAQGGHGGAAGARALARALLGRRSRHREWLSLYGLKATG
jgi:hypothetical protein